MFALVEADRVEKVGAVAGRGSAVDFRVPLLADNLLQDLSRSWKGKGGV